MNSVQLIAGGAPGSGKTLLAVSFTPAIKPASYRRIIIDMEYGSEGYYGKQDDDKRLQYNFELYPDNGTITLDDFVLFYEDIKAGKIPAGSMIGIDNIALFQDEISAWCKDKTGATKLVQVAGIAPRYLPWINGRMWSDTGPAWIKLVKSVIKEFLIELRHKSINFIGTTEMRNIWESYGAPGMKIKGKSANIFDCFTQICDAVFNVTRMGPDGRLVAAPLVELDKFNPKCRIVGIPPKFQFTTWADFWKVVEARGVPTTEALSKIEPAKEELPAEVSAEDAEATAFANWGEVMMAAKTAGKIPQAEALKRAGKNFVEAAKELEL